MRGRGRERGSADGVALGIALVLGAATVVPAVLLRTGVGHRVARKATSGERVGPPSEPGPVAGAVARAREAEAMLRDSRFLPDPSRSLGPEAGAAGPAARVTGLDGTVREGTLHLRWKPVPGAATLVRIEGHGGPGNLERRIPAETGNLEEPVAGVSGTLVVRAVPAGGPAAEERVSIPFRVPVQVAAATRASSVKQSAMIVLRRPFGGRTVEGEFPVSVTVNDGRVTGISPAGPGGPPVEFRTDFVLEAVRSRRVEIPGASVSVPEFGADGRVRKDPEGRPVLVSRRLEPIVEETLEVVLRGPGDVRKVLEVPASGASR